MWHIVITFWFSVRVFCWQIRWENAKRAITPLKVIKVGISRKPVCDFLLVINSKWHPILCRFGVIPAYCSNFWHFAFLPSAFSQCWTTSVRLHLSTAMQCEWHCGLAVTLISWPLLTSKLNQFIFVPNCCTWTVNMLKFPQVVCKILSLQTSSIWSRKKS